MTDIGYFDLGGLRLRTEPARDPRFKVVRLETELHEYEGTGEMARREFVHRHLSNELTSLDIAAQCVADFPDAPWELRMELARQCWDETRHVLALQRRLVEMGGRLGEFPVSSFEWCVTSAIDNLPGRLATQNRTFEAGAMDVVARLVEILRDAGDEETAHVLEAILADEIQHVRFANRWIKTLAADDPRVLLQVAMAVRFLAEANAALQPEAGQVNAVGKVIEDPAARIPAVNVDDRRLADFSDEEIQVILRQAGFRSLASQAPAGDGR
jgi:uncharacterized ferritin-like protein (DUF455 family)